MRFDDHFIEQVRRSINIVDLVGGYVRLKKSGKDYSALCPFHNEKTPSFLASESKQIFKCFGCGEGGDVFKFVMLIENLSFPESVRFLAERHGISLPRTSLVSEPRDGRKTELMGIMEWAAGYFRDCLLRQSGPAREYLGRRGIGDDSIERFSLGFAPPGNHLLQLLKKMGYSLEHGLACGLLREAESGVCYDRFRNRIIFPIRDLSGRTIAFGGRILGDGLPKYLNSPETPLYNKGSHLYGLEATRNEIRRADCAILVEGYFDCIVPYQHGFRNVVASLGTSLTPDQVRILGRYTRNVLVNYDPDSAGMTAALRSIDLFLEQGFRVNVVDLPKGQDPDTFLRAEGAEGYQERLKKSIPFLDFSLNRFVQQHSSPESPRGKREIVEQILPYLMKVANRIERAEYVSRIASRLQLDEGLIRLEMRRRTSPRSPTRPPSLSWPREEVTRAEKALLHAFLDSSLVELVRPEVDLELFRGLRTERIFEGIHELWKRNRDISVSGIAGLLEDQQDVNLLERIALEEPADPLSEELIYSSTSSLRRKQLERQSREITHRIRELARQQPQSPELEALLAENERIQRKIKLDLV